MCPPLGGIYHGPEVLVQEPVNRAVARQLQGNETGREKVDLPPDHLESATAKEPAHLPAAVPPVDGILSAVAHANELLNHNSLTPGIRSKMLDVCQPHHALHTHF